VGLRVIFPCSAESYPIAAAPRPTLATSLPPAEASTTKGRRHLTIDLSVFPPPRRTICCNCLPSSSDSRRTFTGVAMVPVARPPWSSGGRDTPNDGGQGTRRWHRSLCVRGSSPEHQTLLQNRVGRQICARRNRYEIAMVNALVAVCCVIGLVFVFVSMTFTVKE
jgi:hypothetical protein